jgi:hypothetical protein
MSAKDADDGFVPYENVSSNLKPFLRVKATGVVATPKIHGTNLSVTVQGSDIRFGRRNAFIGAEETHFGYRGPCAKLRSRLLRLAHFFHEGSVIRVYGELFGGLYDGLRSTSEDVRPVQVEIQYDPDLIVRFFDLSVDGQYLSFGDARLVCRVARLPFVPVLHRSRSGSELVAWASTRLEDLWVPRPLMVGKVPPIPSNTGEGFVLRTAVVGRTLVKLKSAKFLEVVKAPAGAKNVLESLAVVGDDSASYVTPGRISSVLSKMSESEMTMRNVVKLVAAVREDVEKERSAPVLNQAAFQQAAFAAVKANLIARTRK